MDEAALRQRFDQCLLTDDEMQLGPAGWQELFEDPFEPWPGVRPGTSEEEVRDVASV